MANTNGYIGQAGSWKEIAKRYIGNGSEWKPQQYKWVGKDGYWRLVYYDTIPNSNAQYYITSLDGWTANPGSQVNIYGQNLLSAQYPYPRIGAFYDLETYYTDTFDNYIATVPQGGMTYAEIEDEKALYSASATQYLTTAPNDNSGITPLGLLGNSGIRSYGVSLWVYLPLASMPTAGEKAWLWRGGSRTEYAGVYVADGLIHWVHSGNGPVAEAVSSSQFVADRWNSIIVNRDGANTANSFLYLNGVQVANMANQVNPIAPASLPVYFLSDVDYTIAGQSVASFSPERMIAQYSLSNQNRTATKSLTTANYGTVRSNSTISPGAGSYYFEVEWLTNPDANSTVFIGLSEPTYNPRDSVGSSSYCITSGSHRFNHQSGGGTVYAGGAFAVGDVMGVLVDTDSGEMRLYKNGNLVATPFAAGTITSQVEAVVAIDRAGSVRVNFQVVDWVYPVGGAKQFPDGNNYSSSPDIEGVSGGYIKNLFFSPQYIDPLNVPILATKPSFNIELENRQTLAVETIPDTWQLIRSDDLFRFSVPDTLSSGDYYISLNNSALSTETIKLPLTVETFKKSGAFHEDFSSLEAFSSRWDFLERGWGGANGGVTGQNARIEGGELVLEAHGDTYTGTIQGVDAKGNPKFHTHASDPEKDQPWITRVGCCIVSKDYYGYGSYRVVAKLPKLTGVASAFWTFHYEEATPTGPLWQNFIDEGLHQQGSLQDGYYMVRNHEIDIELPSNLAGQPTNQVSLSNAKFNAWRGELQNWSVAPENPAYWEEYSAKLTDIGANMGDEQYHEFRFDWHADRVDFYIDGIHKQTQNNTAKGDVIPDIPGKFTVGLWFPSSNGNSAGYPTWATDSPWLYNPELAWAGASADWDTQEMRVRSIDFTPFTELGERLIGETYVFGGVRSTKQISFS